MKLVVGLGNPGSEYKKTKHNVGFRAVELLAEDLNIEINRLKFRGLIGEGNFNGEKILLLKPLTYMNLSGQSVSEVMKFYKLEKSDIIILYDDIDIKMGSIRIREKGSAGGHNGIKSIISCIGTDEFMRIKIGIGGDYKYFDLADYVLAPFSKSEEPIIEDGIKMAEESVKIILKDGISKAMNQMNKKMKP